MIPAEKNRGFLRFTCVTVHINWSGFTRPMTFANKKIQAGITVQLKKSYYLPMEFNTKKISVTSYWMLDLGKRNLAYPCDLKNNLIKI